MGSEEETIQLFLDPHNVEQVGGEAFVECPHCHKKTSVGQSIHDTTAILENPLSGATLIVECVNCYKEFEVIGNLHE